LADVRLIMSSYSFPRNEMVVNGACMVQRRCVSANESLFEGALPAGQQMWPVCCEMIDPLLRDERD